MKMKMKKMVMMMVMSLDLGRWTGREACHNGYDPSTYATGVFDRELESTVATPYLLVTPGAADKVDVADATDEPVGVLADTGAAGERVAVSHLGATAGTLSMVASKAITAWSKLYTTAGGKVTDTPVNNCWYVGIASEGASGNNAVLDVIPRNPVKVSV